VIEAWKINQKFVLMKFNVQIGGKLHERHGRKPVAGSCKSLVISWESLVGEIKKRKFLGLLLGACFLFLGSFTKHPFYMSVTEIEYRPAQKELQIACKIFMDDLEDALKAETKKAIKLGDDKLKAAHQQLINQYLQQHLKLVIDGKPVAYEMIGFEKEQEAVWNYLVVKNVAPFKTATVQNDVLYQLRDGQINIIHFKVNGNTQSYRLNAPTVQHSFQW
jgi:SpoU rRNA methylase family enzyme